MNATQVGPPISLIKTKVIKRAIVLGDGLGASIVSLELAGQGHDVDLLMPGDEPVDLSLYAFPDEQSRSGASAKMRSITTSSRVRSRTNCSVASVEGSAGDFVITFTVGNESGKIKGGAIVLAQEPHHAVRAHGGSVVSNSELRAMLETGAEIPMTVAFIEGSGARRSCPAQMTTASIENALAIKRKRPDAQVYIMARDIAAPGASISAVAGTGTGAEAFGGTSGATPISRKMFPPMIRSSCS